MLYSYGQSNCIKRNTTGVTSRCYAIWSSSSLHQQSVLPQLGSADMLPDAPSYVPVCVCVCACGLSSNFCLGLLSLKSPHGIVLSSLFVSLILALGLYRRSVFVSWICNLPRNQVGIDWGLLSGERLLPRCRVGLVVVDRVIEHCTRIASKMGLLDKLWDDVVAGPQPTKGLGKLRQRQGGPQEAGAESVQSIMDRRLSGEFAQRENEARRMTQSIAIKKPPTIRTSFDSNTESPVASPVASSPIASPATRERDNVWRSVFHPGQNRAMKTMGSAKFDNVTPNSSSPTVYDWLYSGKHKNDYR